MRSHRLDIERFTTVVAYEIVKCVIGETAKSSKAGLHICIIRSTIIVVTNNGGKTNSYKQAVSVIMINYQY